MRTQLIDSMIEAALSGEGITREQAEALGTLDRGELDYLFEGTNRVRDRHMGNAVKICSIVNAKSGKCPEDCGFCAQSSKFETDSPEYPLLNPQEILAAAKEAEAFGSNEFSIVTSGTAVTDRKELDTLIEAIKLIKAETKIEVCCSLGLMSTDHLKELKAAGLDRFHHNVETAASHFENIVTTHSYRDEVQAIQNAKDAGLQVCVGGIFGMGENYSQRVEMVFDIKDLETDSYPINFLKPLPGTATEHMETIDLYEALRTIALHRLVMPRIDLFVCGGREEVFEAHQDKLFAAGANGILGGNYLTTKGQDPQRDIEMIENLGLVPVLESASTS